MDIDFVFSANRRVAGSDVQALAAWLTVGQLCKLSIA